VGWLPYRLPQVILYVACFALQVCSCTPSWSYTVITENWKGKYLQCPE